MNSVYVCVDAGGTTSKAAIFDEFGNILSRGKSLSGSPAVSIDKWYIHIDEAIEDALNNFKSSNNILKIVMGVSGLSAKKSTLFEKKYFEDKYNAPCVIVSDTLTALYSVLKEDEEQGIIVISGTGIAIFGKNGPQTAMTGGWGHIIRELGSAYSAVHDFCVNIINKYESQIEFNELEQKFLDKYNYTNVRQFNHLFYNNSKDEIAKLSLFFKEEAKNNNSLAKSFLYEQGVLLAKQTENLKNLLNLPNNITIGLTGGFIEHDGEDIIKGFKEYLESKNIYLNYNNEHNEQLIGVYRLAKKGEIC
jgi:N-acetylglucosamine kinase-like BadF-type ATPase